METGAAMFSYVYPYGNVYNQSLTMTQSMAPDVFPSLFMIGEKFLGSFYQNALPISCPIYDNISRLLQQELIPSILLKTNWN